MINPYQRFLNRLTLANIGLFAIALLSPPEVATVSIILFDVGTIIWLVAWLKSRHFTTSSR